MFKIGGLGVAGSYLLKRLSEDGFEAEGFDPKKEGYYLPCGYATNENLLGKYLRNIGLSAEDYILSRAERIIFSGHGFGEVSFPSIGMCTIDKNALEKDIARGLKFQRKRIQDAGSDVIIDATGVSRAYLGPAENDHTMFAREYLSDKSLHDDFYFCFFQGGRGYFWEFPMKGKFHVGAGSDSLDLIDRSLKPYGHEKITGRKIRLKPLFDNICKENIIGVGEAIGTVSPISGEGIVPSLKSAEILFEMIKKYDDVEKLKSEYIIKIKREFSAYPRLYSLVMSVQSNKVIKGGNLRAALDAGRDLRNFGMDFKVRSVLGHFF